MTIDLSGQERIAVEMSAVWAFVNDPAKMAACLPDVQETKVRDAHSFDAVVGVKIGPLRGKLTFAVALEPKVEGSRIEIAIRGGGFGNAIDMTATIELSSAGDATTLLAWRGSASMRGPVASAGGRVLNDEANNVIGKTFENVKNRLSAA